MFKRIPYVNIADQWKKEKRLLMPLIEKILSKGLYVGGDKVSKFEKKIGKFPKNIFKNLHLM